MGAALVGLSHWLYSDVVWSSAAQCHGRIVHILRPVQIGRQASTNEWKKFQTSQVHTIPAP